MGKNKNTTLLQVLNQNRFLTLLITILLMLIIAPILDNFIQTRILTDILLTAILFEIIFTIRSSRSQLIVGVILVLPLIAATWAPLFIQAFTIGLASRIFGVLFFGFAVVNILRTVFKAEEVTVELIFAAVVAYLLIAIMWAFLYMILDLLAPGSFSFPSEGFRTLTMRFEYLSFITITTLGYGDITPLTNEASALTMMEALIGQIYMVVLVAWLVGMHVSRKSK